MRIERRTIESVWIVRPGAGPEDAVDASQAMIDRVNAYGVRRLARAIGKSPTLIARWLTGTYPVSGPVFRSIEKALDLVAVSRTPTRAPEPAQS